MRSQLLLLSGLAALGAQAQTFQQTLPTMQSVYSWTTFQFTNCPPTTGEGALSCQWLACWQSGFGDNQIHVEFQVTGGWQEVLTQGGNTSECTALPASSTISSSVLSDAIDVGGGTIHGRLYVTDNCQAGVGCEFYNDPVVFGLTLSYTAHDAAFTADDRTICPSSTVHFTDQSINTPSSYQWTFVGGVPGSSTLPDPVVQYGTPGSWDVTLVVNTTNGPDTLFLPGYITVYAPPAANAGSDNTVCAGSSVQLQAGGGVSYQWFPSTGLTNDAIANPMASPDETTSYTVLVTDGNGCQASDYMVLTVQQLPEVVAGAGNNTICLGDTAFVVAVGAQLYTWSPNLFISGTSGSSVHVWPTSTFTWNVTGTDLYGCVNDTTVTITVQPPPAAPTITDNGVYLSSTAASGYQWSLNGDPINGATEQTFYPSENGNYSVAITDAFGCGSSSLPVYFGNVGVGSASGHVLRVYPQPVHDQLIVSDAPAGSILRLADAAGRLVWSGTATSDRSVVPMASLPPGRYTLELGSGTGLQHFPVIKE